MYRNARLLTHELSRAMNTISSRPAISTAIVPPPPTLAAARAFKSQISRPQSRGISKPSERARPWMNFCPNRGRAGAAKLISSSRGERVAEANLLFIVFSFWRSDWLFCRPLLLTQSVSHLMACSGFAFKWAFPGFERTNERRTNKKKSMQTSPRAWAWIHLVYCISGGAAALVARGYTRFRFYKAIAGFFVRPRVWCASRAGL